VWRFPRIPAQCHARSSAASRSVASPKFTPPVGRCGIGRRAIVLVFELALWQLSSSPSRAADTLPAYCGEVGAQRFQQPIDIPAPVITLQRGTVVTVGTDSDAINGDVSSVRALAANPGPDGISLREAITATNNDPAIYTIRFAPQLVGKTINVGSWDGNSLPALTGGNIIINGDPNGDGKPDITLNGSTIRNQPGPDGLFIASTDNTVYALAIQNFFIGVNGRPSTANITFANTVVSNLVIQNVQLGIQLETKVASTPTVTANRLSNTIIMGNVVEAQGMGGIFLKSFWAAGNSIDHTTILNNTIRVAGGQTADGISLNAGYFCGSDKNRVTDSLIAYNTIEGSQGVVAGIHLSAGIGGGSGNVMDGVWVIGNRFLGAPTSGNPSHMGISLIVGEGASDEVRPDFRPICYPQKNEVRNVWVLNNTVGGSHINGFKIIAGYSGAEQNSIRDVFVLGNTLMNIGVQMVPRMNSYGVLVEGGSDVDSVEPKPTIANEVSGVVVQGNTIRMSPFASSAEGGGVGLIGGARGAKENVVKDIWVSHNDVDGGGGAGINLVGGQSSLGPSVAQANVVSRAEVWCNRIAATPTDLFLRGSGYKGINIVGGASGATDNRVDQVRIEGNLVAGILNDYSTFLNFANFVNGTTGNTVSTTTVPGIANVPCARPDTITNGASFESKPVAPGALSTLFGSNLAATPASAGTLPLPTVLGGVTVWLNGVAVPLTFVSPLQINFQVPWELAGQTQASLAVTANGVTGTVRTIPLAAFGPGLFAAGGGQGAVVNAEGRLVDRNAPARAGDGLQVFATGLGPVTHPPASGEPAPSQALSTTLTTPSVTVGGIPAPVLFSGLAPGFVGLYQVNVQVPEGVPTGDAIPVVLATGGATSNTVTIAVR
jgi:uncharacterized protein (TIGR03437 family)